MAVPKNLQYLSFLDISTYYLWFLLVSGRVFWGFYLTPGIFFRPSGDGAMHVVGLWNGHR